MTKSSTLVTISMGIHLNLNGLWAAFTIKRCNPVMRNVPLENKSATLLLWQLWYRRSKLLSAPKVTSRGAWSEAISSFLQPSEIGRARSHHELDCTILLQVDLYVDIYGPLCVNYDREFVVFAVQRLPKVISEHSQQGRQWLCVTYLCENEWSAVEETSRRYPFDISVSSGIWTAG